MSVKHFLWPKPQPSRALRHAPRCTPISTIEETLASMFGGGTPLLFSSGRAALFYSLLIRGLSRGDEVGVFPFASHCVLDAVSRIATPAATSDRTRLNVVFQQWGFVQHLGLSPEDVEDCVDSLLVPGGKLFPGGGGYEVWSLPKILGTSSGGVLWCRSAETAEALRKLRHDYSRSNIGEVLWLLRLLGAHSPLLHAFWQGVEPQAGRPSRLQTGEIQAAIDLWADVVADRQKKLDIASVCTPGWLRLRPDRLPCVVPVELSEPSLGARLASQLGISSGLRMIEQVSREASSTLRKVLPLPIHQDVTRSAVEQMVDRVFSSMRRQGE